MDDRLEVMQRRAAFGRRVGLSSGLSMRALPTGTVTFLFTDIEGSTRLLEKLGSAYRAVQEEHFRLMRAAIAEGEGNEIHTEGDAFFVVFHTAPQAVRAAVAAQRSLASHDWPHGQPLRVRMGLHTGEGILGGDDYLGIDVNRAARIAAAGHGGEGFPSAGPPALAQALLPPGVTLRDLGTHRLKDLARPERLYQLVIEGLPAEFPALKTLDARPNNLPPQLTSFVGREEAIASVEDLLAESRLLTLTGPGGTGKTRLALQVAAEVLADFADGAFFVDLQAITDPAVVPSEIATVLGVAEGRGGAAGLRGDERERPGGGRAVRAAGRPAARHRAGRQPGEAPVAPGHPGPPGAAPPAAGRHGPQPAGAPAHPAGGHRLELRPAGRARAPAAGPAVGVRRRGHPGGGGGRGGGPRGAPRPWGGGVAGRQKPSAPG